MKRILLTCGFALTLTLAIGAPAYAQDAPPANEGAFHALSPGGRKIVGSIYDSHLDSATITLTKDDIAAMKGDTGWGNAYKQLHEQGLVTHKNLGQAISSYKHQNTTTTTTVVTTGSGRQIVTGNKKGQGGGHKFGHAKVGGITTGAGGAKGRGQGGASHKGK